MPIPRQQLLEHLAQMERRYAELEQQAAETAGKPGEPQPYQQAAKELSDLREIVMTYRTYRSVERDAAEAEAIFHAQGDLELREMAKEEAASLRLQQAELLGQLERVWRERHAAPELHRRPRCLRASWNYRRPQSQE